MPLHAHRHREILVFMCFVGPLNEDFAAQLNPSPIRRNPKPVNPAPKKFNPGALNRNTLFPNPTTMPPSY